MPLRAATTLRAARGKDGMHVACRAGRSRERDAAPGEGCIHGSRTSGPDDGDETTPHKPDMTSSTTTQISAATRRARIFVLIGAFASFLFSVTLWFTGSREEGLFVGLWVPSILSLGNLLLGPDA